MAPAPPQGVQAGRSSNDQRPAAPRSTRDTQSAAWKRPLSLLGALLTRPHAAGGHIFLGSAASASLDAPSHAGPSDACRFELCTAAGHAPVWAFSPAHPAAGAAAAERLQCLTRRCCPTQRTAGGGSSWTSTMPGRSSRCARRSGRCWTSTTWWRGAPPGAPSSTGCVMMHGTWGQFQTLLCGLVAGCLVLIL